MVAGTFEAVLVLILFFAPGYIILAIVARFLPRKDIYMSNYFMRALTYSVTCYSILLSFWPLWVPRAQLIFRNWESVNLQFFWDGFFILIAVIILPLIIGMLIVFSHKNTKLQKIRRALGVPSTDLVPSAWDYFFSQKRSCWIIIHTKQGEEYLGLFSSKSYAASYESGRDIYVEELLRYNEEEGKYKNVEDQLGGYFKIEEIERLEFYSAEIMEGG